MTVSPCATARSSRPGVALGTIVLVALVGLAGCRSGETADTPTSPAASAATAPPSPATMAGSPSTSRPVTASPTPSSATSTPADPGSPTPSSRDTAAHLPLDPGGDTRDPVLADVAAAARSSHADLVAAAVADPALGQVLVGPQSESTLASMERGPVVVGSARVTRGRDDVVALAVDVALALPTTDAPIVLRTLAVTSATAPSAPTTITAEVAGEPVLVSLEPELDRVVVNLGQPYPDGVVVRLRMDAVVPDAAAELVPGDGPGSYGLFSDQGDVVALGHWLPVPVAVPGNDGDVPPWGDLGAFAPATWFLDLTVADGFIHTGATDLRSADGGQVAIGVGLRDVAAAWVPGAGPGDMAEVDVGLPGGGSVAVRAWTAVGRAADVADLSAEQLAWLSGLLAPLPWSEHDVVRIDIDLAAGMEFPGMVFIDDDLWRAGEPPGRYVLAHEWAHQWFHAFVGNGSLSDPVVDEPLAQYLSWRWFLHEGGETAAAAAFDGFIDDGGEAPAQPPASAAGDFATAQGYSTAVYRTAASGWVEATEAFGVLTVDEAVAAVVAQWGLQEADANDLLDTVATVSPDLAVQLRDVFDGS